MDAVSTDEALLALKLAFLVLLYLFILYVVRSATKGLTAAPQESIVLGAAEADELRAQHAPAAQLEVVGGPGLANGRTLRISSPTVLGRQQEADVVLDDDFASGRHARIVPAPDGVWVEDLGSTNGTFVDGERVAARRRVEPGQTIVIGRTELRLVA